MSKGSRITEDQYNKMRTLFGAGMDRKAVAAFMGVSYKVARKAEVSETFGKYKEMSQNPYRERKTSQNPCLEMKTDEQPVCEQTTIFKREDMEEVHDLTQLDRVESLLVLINRDLRLVTRELVKYLKYKAV